MNLRALILSASAGAILAASPIAATADEITVFCDENAFGCPTMQPVADRFNAENPDDKVTLEIVSYQTLVESMPVQLESGQGPDAAIVTDLGGLSRYYLDLTPYVDVDTFEKDYSGTLQWLRGGDNSSKAINGMPTTLTVNGGYVNVTLFEQAGIAVPAEGATWEEWADATRKVADATGTDFSLEMDRSGHRFASLAISYGAELVDDQGLPIVDDGLKAAITQFDAWHKDGSMPMDPWGAVGGATHRELFSDFINANVVMYFSGSWNLARLDQEVGELFDWKVIPAPCGVSSCTAMPGGAALVGFNHTESPELVGRFINYISQPENLSEIVSASVEIPASLTLAEKGLEYPGASARTQEALTTFSAQIPKMAPPAFRYQGWRFQRAMMNALTTRISQVLNDEMDVDAALLRIEKDVDLAIEAADNK